MLDAIVNCFSSWLPHTVTGDGIAKINHLQVVKDFYAKVQVVGAGGIGVGTQSSWAKARTWSVGCAVIPRGTDDGNVGLYCIQLLGFGHKRLHSKGCKPLV